MSSADEVKTEVLVRDGEQLKLRTRVIRVDIVEGPNVGQSATLPGPEVRIGSGRGCQLVLLDGTVSRHHATLFIGSSAIRIVDADSSNGTTVDGVRIRDAYCRPDSLIRVGKSAFRLKLTHDVVDLPLSSRERFGGLIGKSVAMRQVFTLLISASTHK